MRRDGRSEVPADLLRRIVEVVELEALFLGPFFHGRQLVGIQVADVDRHDVDVLVRVVRGDGDDAIFVRLGDRAVVAGEDDDDGLGVGVLAEAVLLVVDAGEVLPSGSRVAHGELRLLGVIALELLPAGASAA